MNIAAAPGAILPPGTRIGPFIVRQQVALGASSSVHIAEHSMSRRRIAVKALHPHLVSDPAIVRRFLDEERVVAAIDHPGVRRVLESGTWNGDGRRDPLPYVFMEYLEGESLAARLSRGPLNALHATRIARDCAHILNVCHARGYLHLDFKPGNVFFPTRPEGGRILKLLDFSTARSVDQPPPKSPLKRSRGRIGTPEYMSPEQWDGEPLLDCRADIYALGAVLYEMLAGRRPFEQRSFEGLWSAHLFGRPRPPSYFNPSIAEELDAIVLHAMARDRAHRFSCMEELVSALDAPAAHHAWRNPAAAPVEVPDCSLWESLPMARAGSPSRTKVA